MIQDQQSTRTLSQLIDRSRQGIKPIRLLLLLLLVVVLAWRVYELLIVAGCRIWIVRCTVIIAVHHL